MSHPDDQSRESLAEKAKTAIHGKSAAYHDQALDTLAALLTSDDERIRFLAAHSLVHKDASNLDVASVLATLA